MFQLMKNWSTLYIIKFTKSQFQEFHPGNDYKEHLELTIIFLGGFHKRWIYFRSPEELHGARWMKKAIYSLKVYLTRNQFKSGMSNPRPEVSIIAAQEVRVYHTIGKKNYSFM